MTSATNPPSRAALDLSFIDFLFTLAIAFGFAGTDPTKPPQGILAEGWVATGRWPAGAELGRLLTFLLGISILTLSWFGYHAAGLILAEYRYVSVVLLLTVAVYALYVLWDILVVLERSAIHARFGLEDWIGVIALAVFVGLWLGQVELRWPSALFITLGIVLSFGYRFGKLWAHRREDVPANVAA
jgi:hypothetical protein